jgi:tetratricopeptide (TPR) repeat protein
MTMRVAVASVLAWTLVLSLPPVASPETPGSGPIPGSERMSERIEEPLTPTRAAELLAAADGAYATGSYVTAVDRYTEVLRAHPEAPEAPAAALALGWAELRRGRRDRAEAVWIDLALAHPRDTRAALALLLAAEELRLSGDSAGALRLLEQAVGHATSGELGSLVLLNRAIIAIRSGREREGVADLRALVSADRAPVVEQRRRLVRALATARAEAGFGEPATPLEAPAEQPAAPAVAPADLVAARHMHADGEARAAALTRFVQALAPPDGEDAYGRPAVIHGLIAIAVEDRRWSEADALAARLVEAFPDYGVAPLLLARVAEGAVRAQQWAVARAAYGRLASRYPRHELSRSARLDLAEALVRTGAAREAGAELEGIAAGAPREPADGRALLLLVDVSEALGDHARALHGYEVLRRDHPALVESAPRRLAYAALLEQAQQRAQARTVLEDLLARTTGETHAETCLRLARGHSLDGDHQRAVELYVRAATAAPGSRWERPALLGAGASFAALGRPDDAVRTYRWLLGAPSAAADPDQDVEIVSEAAYRAAEILRERGEHEEALVLYRSAAELTPRSPRARSALVGTLRSLVASGARAEAESLYQRLLDSGQSEPGFLAEISSAVGRQPALRR